ncbi:hypothetical protein TWF730_001190 [Orbilia blumenaviensis]|uniref:C2H2-type domain-containing protein n=1 Tax=Orbilia blumenaviensis TaxID=1796055 RepID=A0AAV9VRH5_9PEZI
MERHVRGHSQQNSLRSNEHRRPALGGERYYVCRRCGREFSVLSGLVQHIESEACKESRRWTNITGVEWEDMLEAIGII